MLTRIVVVVVVVVLVVVGINHAWASLEGETQENHAWASLPTRVLE